MNNSTNIFANSNNNRNSQGMYSGTSNFNSNNNNYNNNNYNYNDQTQKIGSYRLDYRFQGVSTYIREQMTGWKEQPPVTITSREETLHLSPIELRIQDYVLIRNRKLKMRDEDRFKESIKKGCFNQKLMHVESHFLPPVSQEKPLTHDQIRNFYRTGANSRIGGSNNQVSNNVFGRNSFQSNNGNSTPSFGNARGSNQSNNMFGSNNNSSNNIFGNSNSNNNGSSNMFGRGNSGTSNNNMFGNNSSNSNGNTNIFGNSSGNNQNNNMFGSSNNRNGQNSNNNNSGNNIFGNNSNNNNNMFNSNSSGNTRNNNMFGGNNNNNSGNNNLFGNSSNNNLFGNNSSSNNLFNSNNNRGGNNLFGNNSGGNNLFGNNNNNNNNSLFGNNNNNQGNQMMMILQHTMLQATNFMKQMSAKFTQAEPEPQINEPDERMIKQMKKYPRIDELQFNRIDHDPYNFRPRQPPIIVYPQFQEDDYYGYTGNMGQSKAISNNLNNSYSIGNSSRMNNSYKPQHRQDQIDLTQFYNKNSNINQNFNQQSKGLGSLGSQSIYNQSRKMENVSGSSITNNMTQSRYTQIFSNTFPNKSENPCVCKLNLHVTWTNNLNRLHEQVFEQRQLGMEVQMDRFDHSDPEWKQKLIEKIKTFYKFVRLNATITFSKIVKQQNSVYVMQGTIEQEVFNLPKEYVVNYNYISEGKAYNMQINNKSGSISWKLPIKLETLDFEAGINFELQDSSIICDLPELNTLCTVVFNDIPGTLKKMIKEDGKKDRAEKKLNEDVEKKSEKRFSQALICWGIDNGKDIFSWSMEVNQFS